MSTIFDDFKAGYRARREVRALNDELARLHYVMLTTSSTAYPNSLLFERIKKIEDTLIEIARIKAGLEY